VRTAPYREARVTALADVAARPRRVAVGTFDGVHLGHREVIRGADTVLTFAPHPMAVVAPERAPRLLTSVQRRAELLGGLGVEELVVVPMDRAFATRSARQFVDEVLAGALWATHVSVGANFRFGHRARGDAAMLASDGRFTARVVPLLEVAGEVVCSTAIRDMIAAGRVEEAEALLGAPFALAGDVSRADRAGTPGYAVAAVAVPEGQLTPAAGRYACRVTDARGAHAAVVTVDRPDGSAGDASIVEIVMRDTGRPRRADRLRVEFLNRLRSTAAPAAAPCIADRVRAATPRAGALATRVTAGA
jgi:riboflavin kinase/FMN adenylyltransferase